VSATSMSQSTPDIGSSSDSAPQASGAQARPFSFRDCRFILIIPIHIARY